MKLKNLLLIIPVAVGLHACNNTGSSGTSGGSTPVIKQQISQKNENVSLELMKNVKFFRNGEADKLRDFGKDLENQLQVLNEFTNDKHYAVLLAPGRYNMTENGAPRAFNLPYYTQVMGVGRTMDEVTISPGIETYNNPGLQNPKDRSSYINCWNTPNNPKCLQPGALNNFWRGIENFAVSRPMLATTPLIFAVSQASPIRSVHFQDSNLILCDWNARTAGGQEACGYSSGGFMSNSVVDKMFIPGSQQQWIVRGSDLRGTTPIGPDGNRIFQTAIWNSVYVGVNALLPLTRDGDPYPIPKNQPDDNKWDNYPVALTTEHVISKEKPFLTCTDNRGVSTCGNPDGQITWKVEVPKIRTNSTGIDNFINDRQPEELDVNTDFFVISADRYPPDSHGISHLHSKEVDDINAALNQGKSLMITPGTYYLDDKAIEINEDLNRTKSIVVLGLGLPSLVCINPTGCMHVNATFGVNLAGFTMDAGYNLTPSLLQIGPATKASVASHNPENPVFLHDVYFRVAETQESTNIPLPPNDVRQTTAAVEINTSNVVGDNLWIWRADHDHNTLATWWNQTGGSHGLIVYGDNVTMNGLAVEHFKDYQTVWYGQNGRVHFYQSEMPYDPPSLEDWVCHDPKTGDIRVGNGCASYVVDASAIGHKADGLGVYTFFRDQGDPFSGSPYGLMATSGYLVPDDMQGKGIQLTHLMGRWLDGKLNISTGQPFLSGYSSLVSTPSANKCAGYGIYASLKGIEEASWTSVLGAVDDGHPLKDGCN
ncbi:MAG TPA: hypothetical protein VKR58_08310 [Aquella sp.]|nr:hypothetical protein [Aquella sp.]